MLLSGALLQDIGQAILVSGAVALHHRIAKHDGARLGGMQAALHIPCAIAVRGVLDREAATLVQVAAVGAMPDSKRRIGIGIKGVIAEMIVGPRGWPLFPMH